MDMLMKATAAPAKPVYQNEEERRLLFERLCAVIGIDRHRFERMMSCIERCERLETRCGELETALQQTASSTSSSCGCSTVASRCDNIWAVAKRACCPGNLLYSQITLDEYSDNAEVPLDNIVQDFGAGYVNELPVAPGQAIRFEQSARPGYLPSTIWIDFALAGGAVNYLDLEIQFYLGPGGKAKGKEIGPRYRGNQFVHKDGRQEKIEFPRYRGHTVEVGSAEKIGVEIRHIGSANNLISASIRLPYDEEAWYEHCRRIGACD